MNTTKLLASLGTAAVITMTSGVAQADNSHNGGHIGISAAAAHAAGASASVGGGASAHKKNGHIAWTYNGMSGPNHWSELSAEYSECGVGNQQSPIDLTKAVNAQIQKLDIDWHTLPDAVTNNGHSIQINTPEGNYAEIDGDRFELLQFHIHHPS